MKRPTFLALLTLALGASLLVWTARSSSRPAEAWTPSRTFLFTYAVHVPPAPGANGKLLLWLPVPGQDDYQKVRDLQIDSAVSHREIHDEELGNRYVMFEPTAVQVRSGFDVAEHCVATRYEHKVALDSPSARPAVANSPSPAELQRDLEPDKLVPLNGVIADLAKEHTAGDSSALAKARDVYAYVLATMRYDKTGEGWGRGDAVWACSAKRGNCTDFHSLLIGMLRSSGVPARFEIGFPLPESKTEGDIPGYHCWAEFYLQGVGWVPVDASEAWKNPSKRAYFFGAHDVNRIFFTYGRDLRLSPEQKGDPLNYFIYPYAELNGKAFTGMQTHFSFHDLAGNADSAAPR